MKKKLFLFILPFVLTSCALFSSLSTSDSEKIAYFNSQIVYYTSLGLLSTIQAEQTSVNLYNAVKNGKADSVIVYTQKLNDIYNSVVKYKDSVIAYKDSISAYTKK